MSLIGYVTLVEANEYIGTHYASTDKLRTGWEQLSDEDKTSYLNKSFQMIELLPFTGKKTSSEQATAFPRWPSKEVPDEIKWAQIENALSQSDTSNKEDSEFYERLWLYGVESYSIGNLSEKTSKGTYGIQGSPATGVSSVVAERLLLPYLGGGYRI